MVDFHANQTSSTNAQVLSVHSRRWPPNGSSPSLVAVASRGEKHTEKLAMIIGQKNARKY